MACSAAGRNAFAHAGVAARARSLPKDGTWADWHGRGDSKQQLYVLAYRLHQGCIGHPAALPDTPWGMWAPRTAVSAYLWKLNQWLPGA